MVKYIEHLLIKANKAEARSYQQILAANVLKKGNSMIVAPTALGKTLVAILVAAERLKKNKGTKVVILAPSKPLAIQHEENFRNFLNVSVTSITGAVKVDERSKRWEESQIICATPQTVESDLLNQRYDLEDVSLLVFDECHHAVGSYAYVYLASRYIQESKNHLIMGLTASPGHDNDKIKIVCENLFIQEVMIKTEDDVDVKPYFNPIKIDWVKVDMSKELLKIKEHMDKSLKHRLKMLKNMSVIPTISISKTEILKARGRVQNRIARSVTPPSECYQVISILSAVINVQHAMELLETQGLGPLNQYLARLAKKNTKAAKGLLNDADFSIAISLSRSAQENGLEHPKIRKLIEILKEELNQNSNNLSPDNSKSIKSESNRSRVIIFTQFRDTVDIIYKKCLENNINAVKFHGQGSRDGEKGLTQKKQREIIKSFKMGTYDVLISTSVAEEGIDIPAVDLVIMYEPVPSEIRMIQRRGRTGRKDSGRMMVLIAKKTRDEGYYWSSLNREKKMKTQLSNGFIKDLNLGPFDSKDNNNASSTVKLNNFNTEGYNINNNEDNNINANIISNNSNSSLSSSLNSSPNSSPNSNSNSNSEFNVINNNESLSDGSNDFDDLEDFEKGEDPRIIVYADSREGNSKVLRALDSIKVQVRIKAMAVSDYQVSDDVAIERKTAKDFVDSVVNKRLYKQAKAMREEFKKPIMIIEGDNLYSGFISPNAVRGAIASIAVDFGISIIPTRNSDDTAAMIKTIARREQRDSKVEIQIRTERKPVNIWEQQQFIIESLPNIGPVSARKLLKEFGTVNNIINASSSDLQNVDGIGEKTAKNIRNVLEKKYLHFKKEDKDKKLV
ncbi:MAG: DEAD/DEAH box helicase [Methanobacteriaceae archaeon]